MRATMDKTLNNVLSQANEERNQHYPPRVFSSHFNIVTNSILDQVARIYPTNRSIVEIASPFLETKDIPVLAGEIKLPADCRHLLGISIFINIENGKACTREEEPTQDEIDSARLNARSHPRDVDIVEQSEYNRLINHRYKKVTLLKPIAGIFGSKKIRISPWEVPMVEVSYLRDPKEYFYGYSMNPDDSYFFDPAKTVESEWEDTASDVLFKGVNILYSNYSRDAELAQSAQLLLLNGLI